MKQVNANVDESAAALKKLLPADDILQFCFTDGTGRRMIS